jgi:hypothetical protein
MDGEIENRIKEFKAVLCNIYIIFVAAVVVLYTGGSFYGIGDVKYYMFRNISMLCLGLCVVLGCAEGVADIYKHRNINYIIKKWIKCFKSMSAVDYFMSAYAVINILSAALSSYQDTAWSGYADWHMGAVTQVLLVGIYFFVSREYDGKAYSIYAAEAALFIVAVIGFLNRFGVDPIGMYKGFGENDWAYSHMISTIGNINWLCGYMAVALPFCIAGFMYCRTDSPAKRAILYIISIVSLSLLMVQGSDAGILIAVLCLIFCFMAGLLPEYRERISYFFEKALMLSAGTFAVTGIYGSTVRFLGRTKAIPDDSIMQGLMGSAVWWILTIFFVAATYIYHFCRTKNAAMGHAVRNTLFTIFLLSGITTFAYAVRYIFLNGSIGSYGRITIWKAAVMGFWQAALKGKLVGAGPDCFAEYIYRLPGIGYLSVDEGYWQGTVYANAHNEWLNILINTGITGLAAFAGLFVSAFKRYRGMYLGLLTLILYFVNSMVSFQQVLNAPLLFIILGLCERQVRNHKIVTARLSQLTWENR